MWAYVCAYMRVCTRTYAYVLVRTRTYAYVCDTHQNELDKYVICQICCSVLIASAFLSIGYCNAADLTNYIVVQNVA
jgi:hypothetical protein